TRRTSELYPPRWPQGARTAGQPPGRTGIPLAARGRRGADPRRRAGGAGLRRGGGRVLRQPQSRQPDLSVGLQAVRNDGNPAALRGADRRGRAAVRRARSPAAAALVGNTGPPAVPGVLVRRRAPPPRAGAV